MQSHDLSTYWGRVKQFYEMTDLRALFLTTSAVETAKGVIAKMEKSPGNFTRVEYEEYQRSKRIVAAVLHPESGTPVALPFRLSAFLPMNLVTLAGMLHPSQQSATRSVLWQFANQTYNVGFNYCNGSESGAMSTTMLWSAYVTAVVVSSGAAYGLNTMRVRMGERCPVWLRISIPFIAVALANIANVVVVRNPDVIEGIPVYDDETGELLPQKSLSAGRLAVAQVATSRVLLPIPLMLLPPIIMRILRSPTSAFGILHKFPHYAFYAELGLLLGLLRFALPLCIAVFPQQGTMRAERLEPNLRSFVNRHGKTVQSVTYYKGI